MHLLRGRALTPSLRGLFGSIGGLGLLLIASCEPASAPSPDTSSAMPDAEGNSDSSVLDAWVLDAARADVPIEGEDALLAAEDFGCILEWPRVRRFRITNVRGHLDEALAVANSPTGGTYPVGTIIQLVPSEAMVKRGRGWSPETNDWEFFALDVRADGTTIRSRGARETVNAFGGNCFDCHSLAAPQWDFVCEDSHGCDPLPIGPETFERLQNGDPRCP
jgi:hypothetical protein